VSPTAPVSPPTAAAPEAHATPNPGVAPLLPLHSALAERLDALLPQTQCTRCGYPDCRAYAEALAAGEAGVNQCPPGGEEGVRRLAGALGVPALPLDPARGTEGPRQLAFIEESLCIGCTLCIQACPVDAIIGAPKRMHAVIEPLCTGCELCVPACPVDCIVLENATGAATGWDAWSPALAAEARARYAAHRDRLAREAHEEARRLASKAARAPGNAPQLPAAPEPMPAPLPAPAPTSQPASGAAAPDAAAPAPDQKRAAIEAALARARARLEKPH
jgi:electron transport complex protein RnfB